MYSLKPGLPLSRGGFTLIELIVILVLLGSLAAVTTPRFFDFGFFQERGVYDEVVAAVRYGQKLAVMSGCQVEVRINDGGDAYGLFQRATDCTTGAFSRVVPHPAGGGDFRLPMAELPASVTLSSATLRFDPLGRATGAGAVSVGGRTFTVVGETGFVDTP